MRAPNIVGTAAAARGLAGDNMGRRPMGAQEGGLRPEKQLLWLGIPCSPACFALLHRAARAKKAAHTKCERQESWRAHRPMCKLFSEVVQVEVHGVAVGETVRSRVFGHLRHLARQLVADSFSTPTEFLRRLAALVPAPYINLVRYRGLFAGRSRWYARAQDAEQRDKGRLPPAAPRRSNHRPLRQPPRPYRSTRPSRPSLLASVFYLGWTILRGNHSARRLGVSPLPSKARRAAKA